MIAPAFSILRIEGALPSGVNALAETAADENVRNVARLSDDWSSSAERFDQNGAALFGAFANTHLIAIGGVTPEPALPEAFRVRRFYVHPTHRRQGAARTLASTVIAHAFKHADTITCNARASAAAAPFWEAMGFEAVEAEAWTHLLRRLRFADEQLSR